MLKNNITLDTGKSKTVYLGTVTFQKSVDDCVGTGTIQLPYTDNNWKDWVPEVTEFKINGGNFANNRLVEARISHAVEDGNLMTPQFDDCGWHLKEDYTGDYTDESIKKVLKDMIKQAGMIPILKGIKDEKITRSDIWASSGSSSGDTITITARGSCGRCSYLPAETHTFDNKCASPSCAATGKLKISTKSGKDNYGNQITCSACSADYCGKDGWELSGKFAYQLTEVAASDKDSETKAKATDAANQVSDATSGVLGSSSSTTDASTTDTTTDDSTDTTEEQTHTYIEELQQICNSRDYQIITTQMNECKISAFDPPGTPDFIIEPWMMKYGTFHYDIKGNEYSTTAKVAYSNGVAVVHITELYNLLGDQNIIKDKQPKMHRAQAEDHGLGLLAASLRDTDTTITFDMLLTGNVYPGVWVQITNPNTNAKEILYVSEISINADPKTTNLLSVTCRFAPKTPDKDNSGSGASGATIESIGNAAAKFSYCGACQDAACMEKKGCGDCWAMSDYIYEKCTAAGIRSRIVQYKTNSSNRHHSVLIYQNGKWVDFPYRTYHINKNFRNTSSSKKGIVIRG